VDDRGLPLSGLKVWLQAQGEACGTTATAADGTFTFDELCAGTYQVLLPEAGTVRTVSIDGLSDAELGDITVARERPEKVIGHYLLFGESTAIGTRTNLLLALDALRRLGATAGFALQDASRSTRVTIVGDLDAVSALDEAALREAGCEVDRLAGDSYAVEELLAECE
jgi:hypothetical protein